MGLISAVTTGLVLSVGGPASAAEPARPMADKAVITGTVNDLIQRIPPVEPIKAGYKGTSSFIPPSVARGKDARGCNLRQRMLIDSAWVKPKVGRKCVLKGGVWWVDQGTKKVTKAKDVAFTPMLSLASAWGQGASQWTAKQRLAWATQVERPGPATQQTRAKAVTGLAATQQLVSAAELKKIEELVALDDLDYLATGYLIYCNRGLFTLQAITSMPQLVSVCSLSREFINAILNADADLRPLCYAQVSRIFNVASWGLSLPASDLELYAYLGDKCQNFSLLYEIANAARANGVIPIPSPTLVPSDITGAEGAGIPNAAEWVVDLPFESYGAVPASSTIGKELFGVAAPVDWGDPGIPTGYLRLWDAGVSWRQMQPSADKPIDFEKLDLTMQMADRIGAKVMYVLGDTPGWANGGKSGAVPPTDLEDAAKFIGQVCARYKTTPIASYEVWNEGNLTTFWTGTMEELATLTKKVRDAVRACGSGAQVFASSTGTRASNAFVTNYPAYLKALMALGWPVDGYTVHSYPAADGGPAQRIEEIAQFKTLLAQNSAPVLPIFDTELNYGLAGLQQGRRAIDQRVGAAYLSQSYIQSVQYGIDSLFWFLWTQGDYDKLGIQLHAGTPQTIQAWKQTYQWLVGQRMTRCAIGSLVQACQMSGPKGDYTLLWAMADTNVTVDVTGLGTTVENLDGSRTAVASNGRIKVGIAPVAVRS
jgi:hypothetical protein